MQKIIADTHTYKIPDYHRDDLIKEAQKLSDRKDWNCQFVAGYGIALAELTIKLLTAATKTETETYYQKTEKEDKNA